MATAVITTSMPVSRSVPQAKFTYYDGNGGPIEVLDFTKAGTEEKFEHYQNMVHEVLIPVHDVRNKQDQYTLDKNGFQYFQDPVAGLQDANTEEEIWNVLRPATEDLVKKVTGAHKVVILTHRIRNLAEDSNKRADNKAPAHRVHTDFTCAGALNQLKNIVRDPAERTTLGGDRIMVINVWRPLKVIKRDPLAMLDWETVQPGDIIPNRMVFSEQNWSEMGMVKHSSQHEWLYLESQTPEEPVVFKQYDSGVRDGMTVPHSAFVDSRWLGEDARQSIEVKMFAFIR